MRGLLVVVAFVSWVGLARAESPPALPDKTDRLVALAKVWAQVKFFHPAVATKDIDWDRALVTAIPKVEAATTIAAYRSAVQGMLAATGDPVTTVLDDVPTKPQPPTPSEWLTWPSPGVLEVNVAAMTAGSFDFTSITTKAQRVIAEAAKAKVLILDVRGASEFGAEYGTEQLAPALPSFDEWPTARVLEHRGYRTQHGDTSGNYYSTFVTLGANPPHVGPKTGPAHVVFVAEASGVVPRHALALQAAGKGTIIAPGALSDSAVPTNEIALGAGLRAQIRVGESLWGPTAADIVVAKGADPLARARALAKRPPKAKKRARKPVALAPLRVRDDADYADTPYPSREHRMLAGIHVWAVLEHFFPYRYLIEDWEAVLRDMLPRLAQAPDREAYLRVLREMGARAGDGHIGVMTTVPPATKRGIPPFEIRIVERKPAIVRVLDAAEAKRLGVAVGDVIESVDGKPVSEVMAELRRITSGSTAEAREQRVAQRLLAGDDGSTVKLGIRDARGNTRVVTTKRETKYLGLLAAPASTPHWKKLAGNIGYVDLRTLTVPEVDAMFRELGSTKAIIFDMRGYPNGTAWSLAPRLNVKRAKYAAQFLQPIVRAGMELTDQRIRFLQPISPLGAGQSLYTGKVVVLIDDRAISQAEHTCLFLQESAGATFIGSPTHGANGDVTAMRLPGGLRLWFTGQEVRHVGGKQLQKVGIQPHILVRPTLAGIRAGKDEVLERALAFIANGK